MSSIHSAPRIAPFTALTAILLLLAGFTPAHGRVVAVTGDPLSESTETVIDNLPGSGLALPAALPSDRDIYVFVTSGGAYTRFKVLGRLGTSPSRLAGVLDRALQDATVVTYGKGQKFVGADAEIHRGRLWQTRSEAQVPVAEIVAAYRNSGLTPHLLLRVRRSSELNSVRPARYGRGRYNWYDDGDIPQDRPVVVTTTLLWWQFGAVVLFLVLTWLNAVLMLWGRIHGWWLRRTGAMARVQMETDAKYGCVTLLLVFAGMPVMLVVSFSGMERVSDLWFGEPISLLAILAVSVPLLLCGLLLTVNPSVHRGMLGSPLGAISEPETPEEAAACRREKWIQRVPAIMGWILLFAHQFVFPRGKARSASLIAAIVLVVLGDSIARYLLRRFSKPVSFLPNPES